MALCNVRLLDQISAEDLFTRALGVRRLMHGCLRSECCKRMSNNIKLMEDMCAKVKICKNQEVYEKPGGQVGLHTTQH